MEITLSKIIHEQRTAFPEYYKAHKTYVAALIKVQGNRPLYVATYI